MPKQKNKKEKATHSFTPEEAAGYLRQLADDLESGAVKLHPEHLELESEVKVKEEIKSKKGHTNIKIKLKFETADLSDASPALEADEQAGIQEPVEQAEASAVAAPDPEDEQPVRSKASYKRLKKAMGKDFGKLGKLADGEDPTELARLVDSFAAQGRKMCTYPGEKYGEEHYGEFLADIERMEQAARAGDLKGLERR